MPIIPSVLQSDLDNASVATPVAAPVLYAVISSACIIATNCCVSASLSRYSPNTVGKPSFLFAGATETILTPQYLGLYRGRYAGMHLMSDTPVSTYTFAGTTTCPKEHCSNPRLISEMKVFQPMFSSVSFSASFVISKAFSSVIFFIVYKL